jgi:hypothetical protein
MSEQTMLDKLFEHFGGPNKMAGVLDISSQNLQHWIRNGEPPAAMAIKIERLTYGKFKAVDLVKPK